MDVLDKIGLFGIVPVIVIDDADVAVPVAETFFERGLGIMEITMRTPAGIEAIKRIKKHVPGMLVGAGTVLNEDKCVECIDEGAEFIVSPGFSDGIVRLCIDKHVSVLPGCVTPTEIMRAIDFGLTAVKYFPADNFGGIMAMRSLSSPFANIKFVPTGGIDAGNIRQYIKEGFVLAVGGSWLCGKKDIEARDYEGMASKIKTSLTSMLGFDPSAPDAAILKVENGKGIRTIDIPRARHYLSRFGYVDIGKLGMETPDGKTLVFVE